MEKESEVVERRIKRIQKKRPRPKFKSHVSMKHYPKVLKERKEFLELARDS